MDRSDVLQSARHSDERLIRALTSSVIPVNFPPLRILKCTTGGFYDSEYRLAQCFIEYGKNINDFGMGYLLIKKNDVKTFKSFLSGREIEVGVRIGSEANVFNPDEEVFVFYGNDGSDTYKALITKRTKTGAASEDQSLLMLGIVRQ